MKEERVTIELTMNEIQNILDWFNCWAMTYHCDENGDFDVPQEYKELVWSLMDKETELLKEKEEK